MPLTPTTPTHPAQRIDQSFTAPGQVVEELVYTYPPDGTAVRRREGQADEPVTGLPIPQPDPVSPNEAAAAILDEAQDLDPLLPADLADILARAAAALRGES